MKKLLLNIPSLLFILISLLFFYVLIIERNPSEIPSNLLNKNTPTFEADALIKKEKFVSSRKFGNEIVLVNFFATWCKPCRDEHAFINSFSNEKGIRVIGINYKDNPKKTLEWLKNLGNPYSDIALDKKGRIAIEWGVYGIPETFIINSKGIIKYRHVGPIDKKVFKKINLILNKINNES